jgi:NAD(P)-dependent dehydrogenase (short-subunit alcohol dehydrogenase family)
MADLIGRRAIVTGGSRGIGRAIARSLTQAGANVIVFGRSEAALTAVVDAGDAGHGVVADVTDAASLRWAIERALAGGPVDILVNNAGTAASGPFLKQSDDAFAEMLAQHLTAPVLASRAVLPAMLAAGRGRILNVASTAALKGYAFMTAYTAAKHAMLGFTRALALETAASGVTVNAVCPGFTETDLVRDGMVQRAAKQGRAPEELMREFTASKPMKRLVRPDEVAAAALWLVSDGAAAVTGQAVVVDGGEMSA